MNQPDFSPTFPEPEECNERAIRRNSRLRPVSGKVSLWSAACVVFRDLYIAKETIADSVNRSDVAGLAGFVRPQRCG